MRDLSLFRSFLPVEDQRDLPVPPDFHVVVSPGLAVGNGNAKIETGTYRQTMGSTNQGFEMTEKAD